METLNLEWLTNHGACQPACDAWRERWGDADVPLRNVLLALAERPSGLNWFTWLADTDCAFDRLYERWWAAITPAQARWWTARTLLDKQRLAVEITDEQYLTALKPLDGEYTAACRAELRKLAATLAETTAEAR